MNRVLTVPALALLASLVLAPAERSASAASSPTDETFARTAAAAGMAEVEFGRLAVQKAHAPAIATFAKRMIVDHSKANEQLTEVAQKAGITLPGAMDEEHRAKLSALSKLSGPAFDRAYIDSQVADHQKAVQLFETEVGSGKDPALKNLAEATLPTLLEHLEMAQVTAHKLAVTGGQHSSTTAPQ